MELVTTYQHTFMCKCRFLYSQRRTTLECLEIIIINNYSDKKLLIWALTVKYQPAFTHNTLLHSTGEVNVAVRKIVDELAVDERFSMINRMLLGKELDLPQSKLESIELEASRKSNPKEAALTMMISYWLDEVEGASLMKLADTLDNKLEMDSTASGIRMLIGDTPVEEGDIDAIVRVLDTTDLGTFSNQLDISISEQPSSGDGGRQEVLKKWLRKKKEGATWNKLVQSLGGDTENALRVKAFIPGNLTGGIIKYGNGT